jgi:catechol 2,3-dioxygenase-like lactoylglutathione lyase family enzyme
LAAAVLINGAAYVLLTQFDDVLGAREIAAVLPFGAVLAGRLLGARLARHRLRPLALLLLACYLACLGYAVAQPPAPVADQHLADWLAARHLRSGLAAYWQASGTTLASGGHIQVSPVCATKGRFTAEKWESKASWYDPRRREASFLILGGQPAACNDATAAQARSAFGPPARSYQIGPYAVLVWRRNLLTMVSDVRFLQDAAASVQLTGVISVIERTAVFLGLRTVVYPAPDLAASRAWWTAVLGVQPYFDQPFYVGFNPGGYELGLDPNADPSVGPRTYWGVRNIAAAAERMIATGAVAVEAVQEVGEGIKLGTFRSPAGDLAGLIENPVFKLQPTPIAESDGPGR